MIGRDRARYHQLHPAKLLVDWTTAIVAGPLLWRRQPFTAAIVGFGPSIVVTLVFLSGQLDSALEKIGVSSSIAAPDRPGRHHQRLVAGLATGRRQSSLNDSILS